MLQEREINVRVGSLFDAYYIVVEGRLCTALDDNISKWFIGVSVEEYRSILVERFSGLQNAVGSEVYFENHEGAQKAIDEYIIPVLVMNKLVGREVLMLK